MSHDVWGKMPFRPGQKVACIDATNANPFLVKDRVYTVLRAGNHGMIELEEQRDAKPFPISGGFRPDRFSLVKDGR